MKTKKSTDIGNVEYIIKFEDNDAIDEYYSDESSALEAYKRASISWNCHLFKRIDTNYDGFLRE